MTTSTDTTTRRIDRFPGAHRAEDLMGSHVGIDIRTALPQRELRPLLDDAFRWLRWVEETFSTRKPDSQLNRLARKEITPEEAAPELTEVLQRIAELDKITDGFFGGATGEAAGSGYVRDWALERVSRALAAAGAVDHCVSADGDVRVRGSARPGVPWRVGLKDPSEGAVSRVVFAHDLAVATAERPNGSGTQGDLASVTVVGPDLATAGAYATALHAMGSVRARRFAREIALPKDTQATPYDVMLTGLDGRVTSTPGFLVYGPDVKAS
ncbi:FAD:protein FMN transferase [Herbidospora sp. NEAU-GS84]|uniref:FAD:protein FMN transferase n=1 Tax=Herbidospora solisilvae TaxID=2696284 RepID=A0A7C9J4U8_9ACTN|nr:FAD:protein FMN transferase [Herbidospora solisilvae]NAS24762.1 FAD:protein FMN transferase [Herbidospora solisilvae]